MNSAPIYQQIEDDNFGNAGDIWTPYIVNSEVVKYVCGSPDKWRGVNNIANDSQDWEWAYNIAKKQSYKKAKDINLVVISNVYWK